MKRLQFLSLFVLLILSVSHANEYIIYNIAQEFPMGIPGEKLKKNFYVNFGKAQGIREGTTLDVFRTISKLDPYNSNKRYHHHVKIGELKVIHSATNSSIAKEQLLLKDLTTPLFDISNFMIGDQVNIKISD